MKKYKTNFPIYNNPFQYYNKKIENSNGYKGKKCPNIKGSYMYDSKLYDSNMYDTNACPPRIQYPNMYYPNMDYQVPVPEYGCWNDYKMDQDEEKEMAYMKNMYPEICKRILEYVEEICDEYDYDESFMYDEYPDEEMMNMIIDNIYDKMEKENLLNPNSIKKSNRMDRIGSQNEWYRYLIQIIFLNELFGRRQRHHRSKQKYKKSYYYRKPYLNPYQ
jgi:hypothetical protein